MLAIRVIGQFECGFYMIGCFQPRKLLETAKCDAEDTQALAVSLNSSNTPPNTNTSTMSGVTCDKKKCTLSITQSIHTKRFLMNFHTQFTVMKDNIIYQNKRFLLKADCFLFWKFFQVHQVSFYYFSLNISLMLKYSLGVKINSWRFVYKTRLLNNSVNVTFFIYIF